MKVLVLGPGASTARAAINASVTKFAASNVDIVPL
jgi:hypothetical protein